MSRRSRLSSRTLFTALAVWLSVAASSVLAALNAQEQALADRIASDSRQGRASVTVDATLSAVARAKAADMANREYFAHTDPDGNGANTLVRRAGYSLPSHYSTAASGNNIESLAAGYSSVSSVWSGWMDSPDHKRHLLGETDFFAEQTALGVGYYEKSGAPYRYYWVVITAPPSGARLTIAAPAANATLTASSVSVTGSTSGGPAATRVEVRVENANGNGGYVTASGTTNWNATVSGLAAGNNTLRVRSVGSDGSVLKESTRTVRRIELAELTVSIEGGGYVSKGFAGSTSREVGLEYAISAAPYAGAIFSHWSGGEYSTSRKLTFEMRAGLALTANFVPNPFLDRSGAYNGLLESGSAEHATSGLVKISLASSGVVTGKVLLGGAVHAFTAQLNVNGDATVTIARSGRSPLTLTLDLDLDSDSGGVAGTLSDGSFSVSFDAERAWVAGGLRTGAPGRYTVVIPSVDEGGGRPEGAGWATLTLSSTGLGTLTGKLADGTAISAASWVSRDGVMPIYAALYSSLGSISGSLRFRETSDTDLDGSLTWHKPERSTSPRYPWAFTEEHAIVGSRYDAPASGERVIGLPAQAGNASVVLRDGDLDSTLTQSVTVTGANAVKLLAPALPGFTAAITMSKGCFSGTFRDPVDGATRRFHGVFLQKQDAGFGYFLGAERSGAVEFWPAQEG
jgi:uncharacterized protein YkwD